MKGHQIWIAPILWLVVACSAAPERIAKPTVLTNTPLPATATFTPTPPPTDIFTVTFTPTPTKIATSTPTPTFTPLPPTFTPLPTPGIQFGADRSYIKVGMCVVFTWKVENSKAVYFYAEGELGEDKLVLPSDSREECRQESTMYYLRVISLDDTVEIRQIHIPVEPMPGL
jgi:hypothetical protein